MSTEKVVQLPGTAPAAPKMEANPQIVSMLEEMLALAASGEVQAIAGVAFSTARGPMTFRAITGHVAPVVVLGGLAQCQHELSNNMFEMSVHVTDGSKH